jgi:hypothetical protein
MAQSSLKRFFGAIMSPEVQPAKRLLSSAPAGKSAAQSDAEEAVTVHAPTATSGVATSDMIEAKKLYALERKAAAEVVNFSDLDAAIPSAWGSHLKAMLAKPFWAQLKKSLQDQQSSGKIIFPPPAKVFAALHLTPLPDVRAVIVGQDP